MNIKIEKIINILLVLIIFFVYNIEIVKADMFTIDGTGTIGNIGGVSDISNPKYIMNNGKIQGFAYCSDHDLQFWGLQLTNGDVYHGNPNYIVDLAFQNDKKCIYKFNNNDYYDGDCSQIIGNIIASSMKIYPKKNFTDSELTLLGSYKNAKLWYMTQVTLWAYLARFSNLASTNSNASKPYFYEYNTLIKDVITDAWNNYAITRNVTEVVLNDVKMRVDYPKENKFYYVPSSSACGGSGNYRTGIITITNNEDRVDKIKIDVSTIYSNILTDEILICDVDTNSCSNSLSGIIIPKGGKKSIYLSSKYDITQNVKININGYYTVKGSIKKYDSVRWIAENVSDVSKYGTDAAQGMITFNETPADGINSVTTSNIFIKEKITRKSCISDNSKYTNSTESSPVKKVCAVNNNDNKNDYTANFSGCTCTGLDLGNGRYVNVIIKENAVFQYGKLVPEGKLYAGGGFYFDTSKIPTSYNVKIMWQYANWKNNIPYYYDSNNPNNWDASNKEIVNLINAKINEKIKNDLSINFSTKDSNDYKNNQLVSIELKLKIGDLNFEKSLASNGEVVYISSVNSEKIELNSAYFSVDGKVKYGNKDGNYFIDGGNKYYVPMGYTDDSFPFNISTSNLSVVSGIEFWYQAFCDKDVEELYNKNLYYRSIDVKNPFPKADNVSSKVPANWRIWYCGEGNICTSNNNQKRLSNTYQMYPSSPLYKIILNQKNMNKIKSIESIYFDWGNINKDNGSSSFVSDDLFEIKTNNSSYCSVGKFLKSCDKY